MQSIRLREKARLERESWNPESAESEVVWHFSIPNFDDGAAKAEEVATIKSGKTLITKPCVLVAKLNPKTPRVWLIEHLKPGVNVCSTEFLVLSPRDTHDLRYLYFVLKSTSVVSRLAAVASGSSTSHQRVRPAEVEALEVEWEESSSRRQWVADFLWEIEEKIRANNDTSRTLEELAATFFKSWFIDFDPVKAKMAGEAPVGMDAGTAELFPDSMVDSELGEIPSGWRVSNVGSSVQLAGGATPSTKNPEFWYGEYSWLTPKDLSGRRQKIAPPSSRKITLRGLERISSGLLQKGTVLLSSRAPIGYTAICATETAVNQGFIALKADELFPPMYLLNWVESNMQEILNRAGGATFAEVSKAAFRDIPFLCPDAGILRSYRELTAPIVSQLEVLETQNVSLADLRDSLLPRLISGEMQIPDEMLAA